MTVIDEIVTTYDIQVIIENNEGKINVLFQKLFNFLKQSNRYDDNYNKETVVKCILITQIRDGIKVKIHDIFKIPTYEHIEDILKEEELDDENLKTLSEYIISYYMNKNTLFGLNYCLDRIYIMIDRNISLDFIEDKSLLQLLRFCELKHIDVLLNTIRDVNVIKDIDFLDVNSIFSRDVILDKLLEKGLNLNNLYTHNLNIISLTFIFGSVVLLKKVISLGRLSLLKIDEKLIKEDVFKNPMNLIQQLEIISSLENFDDFIKTNFFVIMRICDEETMRYIMRF